MPARPALILLSVTALAAVFLMPAPPSAADSPLKKGERIVFLGDSITQAGVERGGYVTLVKEELAAKHKDKEIEVLGAGISGNRVPDLEKRLDADVLAKKPTLVVVYIGINDVWHSQRGRGTSKEDFEQGLRRIIKKIQDAGARVVLCTASVIGEKTDGSNPLDKMLDEYCELSRSVAKDTSSQLLDLREKFLEYLKPHNRNNAEKGVLTTDGVHLNAEGNKFVARKVLEALESSAPAAAAKPGKVLRHMVLFKFKADVTKEQVQEVVDAFAALPRRISEIQDFEWGTDVSVENLADGFTHCFFVSFKDEKAREIYLPHPAHKEFVQLVGPRIDKALVVDYWAR